MLHEVLAYLQNCPEEIFQLNKIEDWVDKEELSEFLHHSEKQLLCRILRIAVQYHEIENFRQRIINQNTVCYESYTMQENCQTVAVLGSDMRPGIYLRAFCNGLDEALEGYRKEINNLEQKALNNPHTTLVDILVSVNKFVTLFGTLKSLIRAIQVEKVHGSRLVDRLHIYADCGVQVVIDSMNTIMRNVNPMFFRHLCNWVIYGDLTDVYQEFFIKDAKCPDEKFMYPDQIFEEGNANLTVSICLSKKPRLKRPTIVQKFVIDESLLPSIIPLDVAETILFMGRIVWIVSNKPKSQADDESNNLQARKEIWDGKDVEYYQKIQALEEKPLKLDEFTKTIEMCRIKLTKYLWMIMVEKAKLLEHLQLIRDFYGLGRGELFQLFLIAADEQFKDSSSDNLINNLNFIFKDTARQIYGENDKSYKRFELTMRKKDVKKNVNNQTNAWENLELYFDISWPLHIVFHPQAMSLYNELFCFLLRVKKTHIDLHNLWMKHTNSKTKIHKDVWTLRHNLMFLINNLLYYLQVDVLEAQFSILTKSIKNANEFEDIIRLHSSFLSNLLSQSFIMSPKSSTSYKQKHNLYQLPDVEMNSKNMVFRVITFLLELCDEFCLRAGSWESELFEPQLQDLERYREKADEIVQTLMKMLFSLQKQVSGQHLMQLLHRLDFNRWYSRTKRTDLNLTTSC